MQNLVPVPENELVTVVEDEEESLVPVPESEQVVVVEDEEESLVPVPENEMVTVIEDEEEQPPIAKHPTGTPAVRPREKTREGFDKSSESTTAIMEKVRAIEDDRKELRQKIAENEEDEVAGRAPRHSYSLIGASIDTLSRLGKRESSAPFREKAALEGGEDWSIFQGIGSVAGALSQGFMAQAKHAKDFFTEGPMGAGRKLEKNMDAIEAPTFSVGNTREKWKKMLGTPLIDEDGTINMEGVNNADLPRAMQNELLSVSLHQKTGMPSTIFRQQLESRLGSSVDDSTLTAGLKGAGRLVDAVMINVPTYLMRKVNGNDKEIDDMLTAITDGSDRYGVKPQKTNYQSLGDGLYKINTRRTPVDVPEGENVDNFLWKEEMKDLMAEAEEGAFENWAQIASMVVPLGGELAAGKLVTSAPKAAKVAAIAEAIQNPVGFGVSKMIGKELPRTTKAAALSALGHMAADVSTMAATSALTAPGGTERAADAAFGAALMGGAMGLPGRAYALSKTARLIGNRKVINEIMKVSTEAELSAYSAAALKKSGVTFDEARKDPSMLAGFRDVINAEINHPSFEDRNLQTLVDTLANNPDFRTTVDNFDVVMVDGRDDVGGVTAAGKIALEATTRAEQAFALEKAAQVAEGRLSESDFQSHLEFYEEVKNLPYNFLNDPELLKGVLDSHPEGEKIGIEIRNGMAGADAAYKMKAIKFVRAVLLAKGTEGSTALFNSALHQIGSPDEGLRNLKALMVASENVAAIGEKTFDQLDPQATVREAISNGTLLELADSIKAIGKQSNEDSALYQKSQAVDSIKQDIASLKEVMRRNQRFSESEVDAESLELKLEECQTQWEKASFDISALSHGAPREIAEPMMNRDIPALKALAANPKHLADKPEIQAAVKLVVSEEKLITQAYKLEAQLKSAQSDPRVKDLFNTADLPYLEELGKASMKVDEELTANARKRNVVESASMKQKGAFQKRAAARKNLDAEKTDLLHKQLVIETQKWEVDKQKRRMAVSALSGDNFSKMSRVRKEDAQLLEHPAVKKVLAAIGHNMEENSKKEGVRLASVDQWLIKSLRLLTLPSVQEQVMGRVAAAGGKGFGFNTIINDIARDLWTRNTELSVSRRALNEAERSLLNEKRIPRKLDALTELRSFHEKTGMEYANFEEKINEIVDLATAGKHVNKNQIKFLTQVATTEIGNYLPSSVKVTNPMEAKRIVQMLASCDNTVFNTAKQALAKITKRSADEVGVLAVLSRLLTYENQYGGNGWLAFTLTAASDAGSVEPYPVRVFGSQEVRANLLSKKTGSSVSNLATELNYARDKAEMHANALILEATTELHALKVSDEAGKITSYLKLQRNPEFVKILKRMYSDYQGAPRNTFDSYGVLTPEGMVLKEFVDGGWLTNARSQPFVVERFMNNFDWQRLGIAAENKAELQSYLLTMVGDAPPKHIFDMAIAASEILITSQRKALELGNAAIMKENKTSANYRKPYVIDAQFRNNQTQQSSRGLFNRDVNMDTLLNKELAKHRLFDRRLDTTFESAAHPEAAFQRLSHMILDDAYMQPNIDKVNYLIEVNGGKGTAFQRTLKSILFTEQDGVVAKFVSKALGSKYGGTTLRTLGIPFGMVLSPASMLTRLVNTLILNPLQTGSRSASVSPKITARMLKDYSILNLRGIGNVVKGVASPTKALGQEARLMRGAKAVEYLLRDPSPEATQIVTETYRVLSGATNLNLRDRYALDLVNWDTTGSIKPAVYAAQKGLGVLNEGFRYFFKEHFEDKIYISFATQAANIFEDARRIAETGLKKFDEPEVIRRVSDVLRVAIRDKADADVLDIATRLVGFEKTGEGNGIHALQPYILSVVQSHQGRYDKNNVASFIRLAQDIVPGAYMFANPMLVGTYTTLERFHSAFISNGVSRQQALVAALGFSALMGYSALTSDWKEKTGWAEIGKLSPLGALADAIATLFRGGGTTALKRAAKGSMDVSVGGIAITALGMIARDAWALYYANADTPEGRAEAARAGAKLSANIVKLLPLFAPLDSSNAALGHLTDFFFLQQATLDPEVVKKEVYDIMLEYRNKGEALPDTPLAGAFADLLVFMRENGQSFGDVLGMPDVPGSEVEKAYHLWLRRNGLSPKGFSDKFSKEFDARTLKNKNKFLKEQQ